MRGQFNDLVTLSEMAEYLTERFNVDPPIRYNVPYMWWKRSLDGVQISHPMPQHIGVFGGKPTPVWEKTQIVRWYAEWNDMEPEMYLETHRGAKGELIERVII